MTGQGWGSDVTTLQDSLLEAVEETTTAAADYQIGEDELAGPNRIAQLLADRDYFPVGVLHRALLGIAGSHRATCDRQGCRTCASIRHGLASTLAALRVLAEQQTDPRQRRSQIVPRQVRKTA